MLTVYRLTNKYTEMGKKTKRTHSDKIRIKNMYYNDTKKPLLTQRTKVLIK